MATQIATQRDMELHRYIIILAADLYTVRNEGIRSRSIQRSDCDDCESGPRRKRQPHAVVPLWAHCSHIGSSMFNSC